MKVILCTVAAFFFILWSTANAEEGCKFDQQCKGDRVCEKGNCVSPNGSTNASDNPPPSQKTEALLSSIDWGVMAEYFSISNVRLGKQKQNISGQIFIFDAIQFDVKAKIGIDRLMISNYAAHFYDRDGIDMGDTFMNLNFEPKYGAVSGIGFMTWQQGMPGIGFINLDSFLKANQNLDNVKKIRIQ